MDEKPHVTIECSCRVQLTQAELVDAGKRLAESTTTLIQLEDEKTKVQSDFKAKITKQQAEISLLSSLVKSGYEFRDVTCKVMFNQPEEGKKTIVRLDTNQTVKVEPMTMEERQRNLDL